ncbi:unnamed protein product [Enterobius vermicularis]|uniref:Probable imidazolonepropionase n=1 Tax=Enterobius vermicularis TaxID=51028 RepID=A0A0N4V6M8_ENTVE|nr:unnamed protein product [Enterobius vermicularis]
MSIRYKLLITGARQIVQITTSNDVTFLRGVHDMNNIKLSELQLSKMADKDGCQSRLSANGGVILPGLVDAHTHPIFAGDRVHEFAMKLAGATYLEVQKTGGGILFTMEKTRAASEEELLGDFEERVLMMIKNGTTTLEAKSGYGLNTLAEMKMLRVIDMAAGYLPIEIVGTFCGGHAIPKDSDEETQTNLIIDEMIPEIVKEKQEGRLTAIKNIDVFCEKGNFGVDATRRILAAGKKHGLDINFHAEELNYIGGAEMGASLQARAMSHLENISEEGIKAMSASGTAAVLLPTTAFTLRIKPPPARQMIDEGVIVALGSDFNPNAYCLAMPMVMHLACINMRMSMSEALVAATINSAYALGLGRTHGALTAGRYGDAIVINQPKWEHLIYQFGCHNFIIDAVIKNGNIVYSKEPL